MTSVKSAFEVYLYENNTVGSGKAFSYVKGLEWLKAMLEVEPYGFSDCKDIWSIQDLSRIQLLRERVLEEKRKHSTSPWVTDDIPVSYLRDGYCSAALTELIEFLPQFQHTQQVMDIIDKHEGDDGELAEKLNIDPSVPKGYVHDSESQDGKERLAETKVRIGQQAFRRIIFRIYNDRCCVTGLDIPTVNRASHIIGWADAKGRKIRMDPRNGLCLSATYDAAFDRHLISLDDDYRILLSKDIKEYYSSKSVQAHFLKKEGDAIALPSVYRPLKSYLEIHRSKGQF